MWAQALITVALISLIYFVLWKFIGKPLIERYSSDPTTTKDLRLSNLQTKIDGLEKKKRELEELEQEIKTTESLNKINKELEEFYTALGKLEPEKKKGD